jgi:hypothetical protein
MHSVSTPTLKDISRGQGPPVIGSTVPVTPTHGTTADATSQFNNSGASVSTAHTRNTLRSVAIRVSMLFPPARFHYTIKVVMLAAHSRIARRAIVGSCRAGSSVFHFRSPTVNIPARVDPRMIERGIIHIATIRYSAALRRKHALA